MSGRSRLPGRYNLANAAAAAAVAFDYGLTSAQVLEGIESFQGTWRRFELVKETNGAIVISDYAHHPTAVRLVIAAAREWYPNTTLVVVFQPHHHDRFRALWQDFGQALNGDIIFIDEVYAVAGREGGTDAKFSSERLVAPLIERGFHASFVPDHQHLQKRLREHLQPNHVILCLGAGDIDAVARSL